MLTDDLLAEPLERQRRRLRGEPVETLLERLEQSRVARRQPLGHPLLQPGEQRPFRRRAAQEHERVVGDAHER